MNLAANERRSLPHLGTTRGAMDKTFASQMAAHPELVPSFANVAELTKDRSTMLELAARAVELATALEDTSQVAGADVYLAYMAFYANVQQAAKRGVAGADAVLSDLKRFIPRGRPADANTPTPTPPAG